MTDEEVISQLKDLIRDRQSFVAEDIDHNEVWLRDIEALKSAVESFVRQVPKKFKIDTDYAVCPVCNLRIDPQYMNGEILMQDFYRFCPDCGQAIDWGDSDGKL